MPTLRDSGLLHRFEVHHASLFRDTEWGPEPVPHYLSESDRHEQATHIEIPFTSWGDYSGDAVTRSNQRSILRDLTDLVTEVRGGYGWHVNVIALDADLDDLYVEWLENLLDYPVWDEDDHSALEVELEQENWVSWARDDLFGDVVKIALAEQRTEVADEVEAYVHDLDGEARDALAYDEDVRPDDLHFITESADSGYFYGADEWARTIYLHILGRLNTEHPDTAWLPVPVCAGQGALL
jgi:hypothetical protein